MAHHVAVYTGAIGLVRRFINQRFFGQTVGQGRQLTGSFKGFHPFRLVIGGKGFVFVNVRPVHKNRCALCIKLGRVRRCCRCHNIGTHSHSRNTQQKRRQGDALDFHGFLLP